MQDLTPISKFLSLVLRHQPEKIGLSLNSQGWAKVDELLACAHRVGVHLTKEIIVTVVETSDKKRFALSTDQRLIRAHQGHSIPIELGLIPQEPPFQLYHGTATHFLASIRANGLVKGKRNYVHLSKDRATAELVGKRHGQVVVLTVQSQEMYQAGYPFFLSENKVWLTEQVPNHYLIFP